MKSLIFFLIFIWIDWNSVKGKLHLCSRSFIFEPKAIELPLMKMKYSNSVWIRFCNGFEKSKLISLY